MFVSSSSSTTAHFNEGVSLIDSTDLKTCLTPGQQKID
jgi:hypothetical protein